MLKLETENNKNIGWLERKRHAHALSKEGIVKSGPISLESLMGGNIPTRRRGVERYSDVYNQLAHAPLHVFSIPSKPEKGESERFVLVGPPLGGLETNVVLMCASPMPEFGLTTLDILKDWNDLHDGSPRQLVRLDDHSKMPGWSMYEASWKRVYGVIDRNFQPGEIFDQQDSNDVVIPILSWTINGDRVISLKPVDDTLREEVKRVLPEIDSSKLDAGMGAAFLAAYSREQTNWSRKMEHSDPSKGRNFMEATQALAVVVRKIAERQAKPKLVPDDQDIQQSPILTAAEKLLSNSKNKRLVFRRKRQI